VTTLAIDYGLVPDGHVFPSQIDTVEAAYRALLDRGVTRVAVAGDSCGGTLAVSLAARARDAGLPVPAALLLISLWSDFEACGRSYDSGSDPFFTRELVRELGAGYLAGADAHDPLAAPQLHTSQMAAGHTAAADDAIERAGAWLRSTLIP
jgi:acetyl esterase/lipase